MVSWGVPAFGGVGRLLLMIDYRVLAPDGWGLGQGWGYLAGLWAPRRLRFGLVLCNVFVVLDVRWFVRRPFDFAQGRRADDG